MQSLRLVTAVWMRRVTLLQAMHPDRCGQRLRSAEVVTGCRFVEHQGLC